VGAVCTQLLDSSVSQLVSPLSFIVCFSIKQLVVVVVVVVAVATAGSTTCARFC